MKHVMRLGMVVGMSLLAGLAQADYVAYAVTKEAGKIPLPENLDPVPPENLVNLEWGNYSGKKARIGVLKVENTSSVSTVTVSGHGGTATYSANAGGVPVQGIEAIISHVMHQTNRFRLVERAVLDKALREQDLGASGRIAKPSAAKIGKVLGAQYLFQAVVTNYESGVEQSGGGLGGLVGGSAGALLGAISVKSSKGLIGMNFRLIDAQTSEIIYTDQVSVDLSESGVSFGGLGITGGAALGGFLSEYTKTPIGQAVIAAVNKGVYGLIKQVGTAPATGSVIKVSGSSVYLNLGSSSVSAGDQLQVIRKGEELIDPETGLSLGGEETVLGSLQVKSAKEKFSIAKPIKLNPKQIKRGDKVKSTQKVAALQFASNWQGPKEKEGGLLNFGGGSGGSGGSESTSGEDW